MNAFRRCSGVRLQKCSTAIIWLFVLFLTILSTLLFIMCFIHFLKNNHVPPIVPNDLQDYSTTRSIYFLLSFYFLLLTVLTVGCTISVVVPQKQGYANPTGEKPGKALLLVLAILLGTTTMLLCTIDRAYSPWFLNFVNGKIFSYCVQVSALITVTVGICYLFANLTMGICSNRKALSNCTHQSHPHVTLHIAHDEGSTSNKCSFANPCYDVEFCLNTNNVLLPANNADINHCVNQDENGVITQV